MDNVFTNYHAHNRVNYFVQEMEEVVETVCHAPFNAEELDPSEKLSSSEEDGNYRVLAQKIESFLRINPPRGWDVDGPLNPLMTKEMMQEVLTDTFTHMRNTGQCITMSEYAKKVEEGEKFYKTDGQLSRIWGSNYINEMLSDSSEYKAARHYLVIPDGQQSMDVRVTISTFNFCYPRVDSVRDKGVMVVSEFIEGRGIAPECVRDSISSIGYVDFSGCENILQEQGTNIKYVVDTETKSFVGRNYFPNLHQLKREIKDIDHHSDTSKKRKPNEHIQKLHSYLINRWEALSKSPLEDQTFAIKI